MLFERFEDPDLSQYSYAVGCEAKGEMAIVDPRRDVDVYLDFAHEKEMKVTHVLETHVHADFASGARELAERAGAELLVSAHDEGEIFEVAFPHTDMADGDSVTIGAVRIEALHTPGHTPEHLSLLVHDGARSEEVPMLLLTGDFLFIGSLGRPDLLGEEAKRALAEQLFDSVRNVLPELPDGLEIHPAHGAGSMCGSGLSGRPTSTLGFERVASSYLDPQLTKEAFVRKVLDGVPPFPPYYRRMKRVNSEGPKLLNGLPGIEALPVARVAELLDGEAVAIDLRDFLAFGGGHLPESFGIGTTGKLSTWAAWVVPYDRPLVLVAGEDDPESVVEGAVRKLVRVGLDEVVGYLDGGVSAWAASGRDLDELPQTTPLELHRRREAGEAIEVLDVRTDDEWESGHVEGAHHVMAGELAESTDGVPAAGDRQEAGPPLAVVCGSGYRSTVAASVLARAGFENLINVAGGMTAWERAGLPTVREGSATS
jgi:hydroxyacylglutathione hydrolase